MVGLENEDETKRPRTAGPRPKKWGTVSTKSAIRGSIVACAAVAALVIAGGTGLILPSGATDPLSATVAQAEQPEGAIIVSTWSELGDAIDAINASGQPGAIALEDDLRALSDQMIVTGDVTIYGEGHHIDTAGGNAFKVVGSGRLSLGAPGYHGTLDIAPSTGSSNGYNPLLVASDNGAIDMYDGVTLRDNSVVGTGAGVSLQGSAVFRMHGGTIARCAHTGGTSAGGVAVDQSSRFEMSGGTISGCEGGYGGAVFVDGQAGFSMTGGSITGNTAFLGGAVVVNGGGTVSISGGSITGNTASYGGGLFLDSAATLTVSGGSIADNTASAYGGGLLAQESIVTISGGSISGSAATMGGGLCVVEGALSLAGATVEDNTATMGGGLFAQGAQVNAYGGAHGAGLAVRHNTAQVGGGLFLDASEDAASADLSEAVVANNLAIQGSDIHLKGTGATAVLPEAAGMGESYEARGAHVDDSKAGKPIDGWYLDHSDARYVPCRNGASHATGGYVASPARAELGLVASYREHIPVEVVVTGEDVSAVYDGKAHTAGFRYSYVVDGQPASALPEGLAVVSASCVSGTAAGSLESAVTPESFSVSGARAGEYDVTFRVEGQARLTIAPRTVVLASASAKRGYDGAPLTSHEVTVSGDGFAAGEGATYSFTGTQTEVGSSENAFTVVPDAGTDLANYKVETKFGTLEVTARQVDPQKPAADEKKVLPKTGDASAPVAAFALAGSALAAAAGLARHRSRD